MRRALHTRATTLLAAVLFVSAVALIGLNVGRYLVAVGVLS